ncbi:MAG: hypothetical protein GY778_24420 [bacterium]|nr:hypothetical protein [bacterium]
MIRSPKSISATATHWRVAGFFAVALPAVLIVWRPIDDVDLFWQVKLGQLILAHGFDLVEPFSYRHADQSVDLLGWLGQVLFAGAHRLAGWPGVQALHVAVYAAAFGAVWARTRRTGVGATAGLAAVLLALLACMTNCSERPQTFAFAAFALLLWAGNGGLPKATYWAFVIPLLVIWQNAHPSVPVAVAVMGLQAVGQWVDERRDRPQDQGRWRRPLATAVVAGVAIFCTPTGWAILEISSRNGQLSRWLHIGEWLPAHAVWPATSGFFLVLAIGCLSWFRSRRRIPWRDLLPVVMLTAAALIWSRMIVFWALLSAPLLARLLQDSGLSLFSDSSDTAVSKKARRWARIGMAATVVVLVCGSPWIRPHLSWLPAQRRSLFDPRFPLAGVQRLRETLGAGRIYNYREWGGLLAWSGAPHWRVAIDGRIYRYGQPDWESYRSIALGTEPYQDLFGHDRPGAAFLRPGHDRVLIERLQSDPAWRDHYRDANCHIFVSLGNAMVRTEDSRDPGAEGPRN